MKIIQCYGAKKEDYAHKVDNLLKFRSDILPEAGHDYCSWRYFFSISSINSSSFGSSMISVRRFLARPSGVLLVATGSY